MEDKDIVEMARKLMYAPHATRFRRVTELIVPPNDGGSMSLFAPGSGEGSGLIYDPPNTIPAGRYPVVIAEGPDWYKPEERGMVVQAAAVMFQATDHAPGGGDDNNVLSGFGITCIGWEMGFESDRLLELAAPELRRRGLPQQEELGLVVRKSFGQVEQAAAGREEPGAFAEGWWEISNGEANSIGFLTNHESATIVDLRDEHDRPVALTLIVTQ
ncbi:hypothetical protein F0L68_02370 [Solihabitans fulvus]|uniref:Uncharacterized protein n=1 Tax=Solihabitans fulvus TaxID=1892852 RepID=A0A5B2XUJ5_9PSEU|nr:hypothetical protein [Solihabitans fulvus]KAA2266602.1 hypothetical protein F0L68_02370 [Solihabitans fulvus]